MDDYGQFIDIEKMTNLNDENLTYLHYKNNTIYEASDTYIDELSIFPLIFNYILFFIYRIGHA